MFYWKRPTRSVGLYGTQFCLIRFDDPTLIILRGFLMGDLLRLSLWSEGLGRQAHLAHCGTAFCNQDFLVWCGCCVIYREKNIVAESYTLYSSLIIVISLQLRGRRQIIKPRKYCLVRVIVFLWHMFSLFFVSHRLRIRPNQYRFIFCKEYYIKYLQVDILL